MKEKPDFSIGMLLKHILSDEISQEDLATLGRGLLAEIEPALVSQGVREQSSLSRAHFVAIKNWLGKQRSSVNSSIADVQGYREAYYHLREVGAWRKALSVMRVTLKVQKQIANQRWRRFEREISDQGESKGIG